MLEQVKDADLRVYSVYVPMLENYKEASIPSASKKLPDSRVRFYWDAKGELTQSYSRVLQLGEGRPAWDVYLIFDRDADWGVGSTCSILLDAPTPWRSGGA